LLSGAPTTTTHHRTECTVTGSSLTLGFRAPGPPRCTGCSSSGSAASRASALLAPPSPPRAPFLSRYGSRTDLLFSSLSQLRHVIFLVESLGRTVNALIKQVQLARDPGQCRGHPPPAPTKTEDLSILSLVFPTDPCPSAIDRNSPLTASGASHGCGHLSSVRCRSWPASGCGR